MPRPAQLLFGQNLAAIPSPGTRAIFHQFSRGSDQPATRSVAAITSSNDPSRKRLPSDLSALWNRPTDTIHRAFVGPDGVEWKVWEVHLSSVHDAASKLRARVAPDLEKGWLCFESAQGEKRRLAPFPPEWKGYSFPRMIALWREATPVRKPGADQES